MASYPNSTVNIPAVVGGQTLAGPPSHSSIHSALELEVEALGMYAAKATRGGEELIVTGTQPAGYTIDLTYGNVHRLTMTGNVSLTFPAASTIVDGRSAAFMLELIQDGTGSRVATFPTSVKWLSGAAPTLNAGANKRNILSFISTDDGATWLGQFAGSV